MRAIWMLAVVAVLTTACGAERPPAADTPTPPKEKTKKPKAKGAEVDPDYVYSPVGKRDPFRPYLDRTRPPSDQVDPSCGPLCTWELEQLRVVAVVSGMASPVAMVEDPRGRGYVVRRGSSIGKQNGRVTEILRDRLVVTEMQRVGSGQLTPSVTELPLRSSKGRERREEEPVNLLVGDE